MSIGFNVKAFGRPYVDPRAAGRDAEKNKAVVPPGHGAKSKQSVPITRYGKLVDASLTYASLSARLRSAGQLFDDPDFPAEHASIYFSERSNKRIEWKRPGEICNNPEFVSEGTSRFDVRQGELGDCWLLAAIACLSLHDDLMAQVLLPDQNFQAGDYCGMFRFRFWRFGKWTEIVVDDRLPTYQGRLLFIHSTEKNEFWSALFEKAYAKLCGSYESLKGGSTCEALEDFTGGICEMIKLRQETPHDLEKIMLKSHERKSLMGCSIDADPNQLEAELPNGLIMGHAYSLTSIQKFTKRDGRGITLVRIRNPWGNEAEWKGAWSDRSPSWNDLPAGINERKDDGEFWMSFDDFTKEFQQLEICHLSPQSLSGDGNQTGRRWELCVEEGRWKKGSSAGGCRNYLSTFVSNPQFKVTIVDPDENDADDKGTIIVGLMQKNRRAMRHQGADMLTIGYMIYEVPPNSTGLLDASFFSRNKNAAMSKSFINTREVCVRHKLTPGNYVIIPSTFEPEQEAEFILRIFAEHPAKSSELDEEFNMTAADPIDQRDILPKMDPEQTESLRRAFEQVAGVDGQIDAEELRDVLNAVFTKTKIDSRDKGCAPLSACFARTPNTKPSSRFSNLTDGCDFKFDGFTLETCHSMVAMMDVDRSSMLSFEEFATLWNYLKLWKTAFKKYDADQSGEMNTTELRIALRAIGFSINNKMFDTLVLRYAHRNKTMVFDDYVVCSCRLRTLFELYKLTPKSNSGELIMDQTTFVNSILYM